MPEPLTTPPTRSASRRRFTQRKAPFHPSITKLQSDRLLGLINDDLVPEVAVMAGAELRICERG